MRFRLFVISTHPTTYAVCVTDLYHVVKHHYTVPVNPTGITQANSAQVTITISAGTKSLKIWDFFKFGIKARGTFTIIRIKLTMLGRK